MRLRFYASSLLILFLAFTATAQVPPVDYELRFRAPNTHLLEVTIRASDLSGEFAEFAMPAWAPGSYVIQDYAANVHGFRATTLQGTPLPWHKTDKQTWRIELRGEKALVVSYLVYANTLANNQAQYNDRHAFLAGPAVWMYLVGGKTRPVRLTIQAPQGWRIATGLARDAENRFTAPDYDWFADCPIEISDFVEHSFASDGATYHFVVHDILGRKDFQRFLADTRKIVSQITALFSVNGRPAAPFSDYWFIFHLWPGGRGGLEHLNSTQINFSTDWDSTRPAGRYGSDYVLKLAVASHEFFHTWNVKRFRPRPLGPFDYSREVHTPSLWLSEGITSYYGDLVLVRAGLISPEEYLDNISQLITAFEQEPGRRLRSLEETSWDTWFRADRFRQETNLLNTTYSYYDGGQLLGHLLDFAIRHATGNRRSLDDWMRLLYDRYSLPLPGFNPDDLVRTASEVAGTDLTDFFARYVSGREPWPYEQYFGYAGIAVERSTAPDEPWLGASTSQDESGFARVSNVLPDSPAERGGLDRGDLILALGGRSVKHDEFLAALHERKPGDLLTLTVSRLGHLKDITVRLGPNPHTYFRLRIMEKITPIQQQILESWLGRR